ncbi:MAG TPA: bifunctional oligoribonuclease/PAP phosphatase NrnA [Capsulimonadaceae bacterium]|nr:bifunctional oligoribonuclease/PAP phosphatase NrnA [Capsulimonadaceae bacterium]
MASQTLALPGDVSPCGLEMQSAVGAIAAARKIVLACHVNPDGDALGSLLSLGLAIAAAFPKKDLVFLSQDGVPDILRFLPGTERVQSETTRKDFDLAIALDSGDLKRVGPKVLPTISSAPIQMDIDHHVGEGAFGDIRLLDSRASATAEIVFDLIHALEIPITAEIATCLLTGIITDTGSFRYMNVTPRTLRISASLIEAGAAPAEISEQVFDNRPFGATKLMGLALSTLSSTPDGRIVWAHVSHEAFVAAGATDEDTEGFINSIRAVRGADIALLFREIEKGKIRISLRSCEGVDVSKVAAQFGGGGHRMASGCSFRGPLPNAEAALVAACKAALAG